jgi:uncharacterized OB-fold protein
MSEKLLPRATQINQPFLDACNDGYLLLQRCLASNCGENIFYPRVCCPYCGGGKLGWKEVEPAGLIVTFTLVHRPHHEVLLDELPVPFVAVELDAGALIYGELVRRPTKEDRLLGAPVRIVFRNHTADQKLPYFEVQD